MKFKKICMSAPSGNGCVGASIVAQKRAGIVELVALAARAAPQAGRFQRFLGAVGDLLIAFIGRK